MKRSYKRQQGAGIIKIIVLTPFVLIGLGILFFIYTEFSKAYWDYQVEKLCEKDGGVIVYERVSLLKEERPNLKLTFNEKVRLPHESNLESDSEFFLRSKSQVIRVSSPKVWRNVQEIIRRKDEKILSKYITYSRRGGDFPTGLFHPSYFSCEKSKEDINLLNTVITVKGLSNE